MPIDGSYRGSRVLKDTQVGRAVLSVPLANPFFVLATEYVKAVLEIDTCGKRIALPRQNDGQLTELGFQPVKCVVQVFEERIVLHVDLVGVHAHDRTPFNYFYLPCHVAVLIVVNVHQVLRGPSTPPT
ncbi:hypothetical protein D3C76_924330 [compost metagenome]